MEERPKTWEEYIKLLKQLHGKKITPEIERFCRYTWKDAQYAETQKEIVIFATCDDSEILCCFRDKEQAEKESAECGSGLQSSRLVGIN